MFGLTDIAFQDQDGEKILNYLYTNGCSGLQAAVFGDVNPYRSLWDAGLLNINGTLRVVDHVLDPVSQIHTRDTVMHIGSLYGGRLETPREVPIADLLDTYWEIGNDVYCSSAINHEQLEFLVKKQGLDLF